MDFPCNLCFIGAPDHMGDVVGFEHSSSICPAHVRLPTSTTFAAALAKDSEQLEPGSPEDSLEIIIR